MQKLSLAAVFDLSRDQPGVAWRLVPSLEEVHAAMQEHAEAGDVDANVRGVPVFRGEGLTARIDEVRAYPRRANMVSCGCVVHSRGQ